MLDGVKSGYQTFDYWMRCDISAVSGSGVQYGGATNTTSRFTQDYTTTTMGVDMTWANASAGAPYTPGRQATLSIPVLSISQSFSDASTAASSSEVEFKDCRLIVMPSGVYRLTIGTINWYIDGAVYWTSSAGWTLTSGMAPTPTSVPLWGIPPRVNAVALAPVISTRPKPVMAPFADAT